MYKYESLSGAAIDEECQQELLDRSLDFLLGVNGRNLIKDSRHSCVSRLSSYCSMYNVG